MCLLTFNFDAQSLQLKKALHVIPSSVMQRTMITVFKSILKHAFTNMSTTTVNMVSDLPMT